MLPLINLFFTFALILTFCIFVYLKRGHKYWAKKNVPYIPPNFLIGNIADTVVFNKSEAETNRKLYEALEKHPFGGYFKFQVPVLMIRDPELIKHIMTKDFNNFSDRNKDFVNEYDVLSYHLFNLTGDKWKNLRNKLTPTFTSGKMKMMFSLIIESGEHLANVVNNLISNDPSNIVEMKDLFARYSTDVISSCAFGLQANTLDNPDAEFRRMGRKVFQLDTKRWIYVIMLTIVPNLAKRLGLKFNDDKLTEFFLGLISKTVRYREENNIQRNDFVNILMSLRNDDQKSITNNDYDDGKENKLEMTMELMAAQSFIFYAAGFETSSGILSNCLLELAKNPDVQDKLRAEIKSSLSENNDEITYECIQNMVYLDQVVCEAMRLYPSLSILFRECTKQYKIPKTDVIIDEGTQVVIPVFGIHRDPQYYPNPDEFNPENFSEENKASRPRYTFLPFGEGPRICIGMRFGLMQIKVALVSLLKRYRFSLCSKTVLPVKFAAKSVITSNANGVWLRCTEI